MSTDEQQRWLEISRYLDEALDLDEPARTDWLRALDSRAPTISEAVRSLLAERERLAQQPLLNEGHSFAYSHKGLAGQQIGAYTLESVLGHGGMGTVWLARRSDGRYEGYAAMKLLNAALLGRPTEQRFVREGSVLAKLRHPNIAQLVDAGVAPSGQPYLVLEYVDGEHIDRYVEERNLDIEARVRLFLDVLAAVSYAHSHLIVHRDIKPSNILVTAGGVVKLVDFGIAALLSSEEDGLTREVDPGLTPEYAAPEQLLKQSVTTATDVYALGLVLYLLLAGKHPLHTIRRSAPEFVRAKLDTDPLRASQLAGSPLIARALRGDLDNIIAKTLKRDPRERYSTAEALAQDLRRFLACEPVAARPDAFAYRAAKFVRRHRSGVAVSAIMALALLGATIVTTAQMVEARQQRDAALYQSKRAEFQARFAYHIMAEVGGDGRPITIRDLMAKGIEVLEKNYGDDPRFVIGMLVNISGRYMDLGDTKGELAALVKAEAIARTLGDPERIAYVQCNTVETELAAGRLERARERLRDGLANLALIENPSFDRTSECGAAQAKVLWAEGKLPEAIEAAKRIAEPMEANGQTGDLLYNSLASMLDVMLSADGRRNEARDWNRRLIEALERAHDDSGMGMNSARHNQAGHLYEGGEMRAALEVQKRFLEPLVAQEGADNVPAAYALRLGLFMVSVEETVAGLEWIERAIAIAAANDDRSAHIGALLGRARAQLLLERFDGVLPSLEEAERLARATPVINRNWMRTAQLLRAELMVSQGQLAPGLSAIDALLEEAAYPKTRAIAGLTQMLLAKARVQLALGQNAAALVTATDALAVAEENAPNPDRSAYAGAALLAMAQAHRASGDLDSARTYAARAAAALAAGLGPDHSQTRAALRFE